MTIHSWSSWRITGVSDEGSGDGREHRDTRDPPQASGGNGPIGELQLTFDRSFLVQLVHHRRASDKASAPTNDYEHQDTRDPLQAADGKG